MNNQSRHNEILNMLRSSGPMSAQDLSKNLYISLSTIYRDLREMEQKKMIIHSADGTLAFPGNNLYIPATYKTAINSEAKTALAREAAKLIPEGATIHLDSSSTVSFMVDFIADRKDITVLTNSFFIAKKLIKANIPSYFCGGQIIDQSQTFGGRMGRFLMSQMEVDYMFFSPQSINNKGMIFDSVENDSRRDALKHAKTSVCLCDKSKVGQASFYHAASIRDIDYFITDADLPAGFTKPRIRTIYVIPQQ
ncbi:MAG: DeoR/GlpR transcriptional regulator [Firmicutes bacterium]|nr:DeoR/GlpR transcriptional regulator [Bacillota bacterium]